jgi:subtilisin family serine protease
MTRMARVSVVVCALVSVILIGGVFTTSADDLRKIVSFYNPSDRLVYEVIWSLGNGITTIKLVHDLSLINALAIQLPTLGTDQALAFLQDLVDGLVLERLDDDPVGMVDGGSHPVCIAPALLPPASQSYPWGVERIGARVVHTDTKEPRWKGTGVTVAVVDTGIYKLHSELRVDGGYNARAGANPSDYQDDNGHGTHMAGIIAAALKNNVGVIGVAPEAKFLAVKVLDRYGAGYLSDLINGLQWIYNLNLNKPKNEEIRLINMSVGFSNDSDPVFSDDRHALKRAIQALDQIGVIMVASAGNRCTQSPDQDEGGGDNCEGGPALVCDPEQTAVKYPAAYSSVLAVVATDIHNDITAYSLCGPEVDVAAPGGSKVTQKRILSTNIGGGYGWGSGTSQAAAHVTGAVALALQKHPELTFADVKNHLKGTTVMDLDCPSTPQRAGLIDVKEMMDDVPYP